MFKNCFEKLISSLTQNLIFSSLSRECFSCENKIKNIIYFQRTAVVTRLVLGTRKHRHNDLLMGPRNFFKEPSQTRHD